MTNLECFVIFCTKIYLVKIEGLYLTYFTKVTGASVLLDLLLLNTTCPFLANSVDPDQLASEEAN